MKSTSEITPIKIYNIQWDTDGDQETFDSLPKEVMIPNEEFDKWTKKPFAWTNYQYEDEFILAVEKFLSDTYCFAHNGFDYEGEILPKTTFKITAPDGTIFRIAAANEDLAKWRALEDIVDSEDVESKLKVEITDEMPEIIIK